MGKQNEALAKLTVEFAQAKLGIKEATGKNDGPFIRMLQRWLANGAKWMDGQPWCAAFATWCVYEAAKKLKVTPVLKKNGSSTSIYAFARSKGLLLQSPEINCMGLVRGSGGTRGKTHHHTFLVEKIDLAQGVVFGIDGNYRNAVSRSVRKIADCDFVAIA